MKLKKKPFAALAAIQAALPPIRRPNLTAADLKSGSFEASIEQLEEKHRRRREAVAECKPCLDTGVIGDVACPYCDDGRQP